MKYNPNLITDGEDLGFYPLTAQNDHVFSRLWKVTYCQNDLPSWHNITVIMTFAEFVLLGAGQDDETVLLIIQPESVSPVSSAPY